MITALRNSLSNVRMWWIIFLLAAVIVTLHRLLFVDFAFNNFEIFRHSFFNLNRGVDLYAQYPDLHYDIYKYSPTFAALMAPFYWMPSYIGIFFWSLLNTLFPVWAISKLKLSDKSKGIVLLLILVETITSIQNSQSNGLMAGLMIGAFHFMDTGKPGRAALLLCLGFHVKLFAAVAGILFVCYDKKFRFIALCAFWFIALAALPLLFTNLDTLFLHYQNWWTLIKTDPSHELNFSVMTFAERTLGIHASDGYYILPGMILLLLPAIRTAYHASYNYRLLWLASILLWVVIFNHKAESPTFIIAMCGAALWFVISDWNKWTIALLIFVVLLTGLSASDLFPSFIRNEYIKPYALKVLPCIIMWIVATIQLLSTTSRGVLWLRNEHSSALRTSTKQ
jgi:hypothetical protein